MQENGYFGYFVGVQETKTIEMMSSINGYGTTIESISHLYSYFQYWFLIFMLSRYALINVWRNFCFSNILYYWDRVDFQVSQLMIYKRGFAINVI